MPELRRRSLLQSLSLLAVGAGALAKTGDLQAAKDEATRSVSGWPEMDYRVLGNTGFRGSRLVFGCGAALARGQANGLLQPALDAGINVFDVGFRAYYRDAEQNLGPFLKQNDDKIFLISKAMVNNIAWDQKVTAAQAKTAANEWLKSLDDSLAEMQVEKVDAYYLMAANNVDLVRSEEMGRAYESARATGKAEYFGVSTHENAKAVLETAAETGWYSLAQIAITPAGWYDFNSKSIVEDGGDMMSLRPVLDKARAAGIGLIGMKAGRHLAGRWYSWGKQDVYDGYYTAEQLKSGLTAFQRSYAYVLANGLDAVNADMQVWQHLRENFVAATSGQKYFV